MSNTIHSSAIVSPKAELGSNVSVGPHTIIEAGVIIGDGSAIASSVLLATGAELGTNVKISHGAVIGTEPQDLKFKGEATKAMIGNNTVIREYVTVNRGTKATGITSVGENCLLMAYAHVAHDCHLGNHVIMANSVQLGGHVEIGDYAILGGLVGVHQFVKIGAHSLIGACFRTVQDVCPFALCGGYPLKVVGINVTGLKRRGFKPDVLEIIEQTFKLLFFSGLNTSQAIERINAEIPSIPEVKEVLGFLGRSNRGIVK